MGGGGRGVRGDSDGKNKINKKDVLSRRLGFLPRSHEKPMT